LLIICMNIDPKLREVPSKNKPIRVPFHTSNLFTGKEPPKTLIL